MSASEELLNRFLYHLEKCIGAVAILRLCVDPFPVLLMDEEIYLRTDDTITEPYSEKFIEQYIGLQHLDPINKRSSIRKFIRK